MDFIARKHRALLKYQEAVKADLVDKEAYHIISLINEYPTYFTTSSCFGRVIIISKSKVDEKYSTTFHFKTHVPAEICKIATMDFTFTDQLWFLLEAPNFHVTTNSLESAHELHKLALKEKLGLSKIQSISPNFVVEILGSSKMQLPIGNNGKVMVSQSYLALLAEESSYLLERDQNYLINLQNALSRLLEKL